MVRACRKEFVARSEGEDAVASKSENGNDERFTAIDDLDELRGFCFELAHSYSSCRKRTQTISHISEEQALYGGRRKDVNCSDDFDSDYSKSRMHQVGTTKGLRVTDDAISLVVALLLFGWVAGQMGWKKEKLRTKEDRKESLCDSASRKMTESAAVAATAGDDRKYCRTQQQHWNDILQEEQPQLPSLENCTNHSYDESEREDEFPELPVRLRSLGELKSDEDDDHEEEDTSNLTVAKREVRERDLRHAEELKRHAEELENQHCLFEESIQQYNAEIDSMERRFHDESRRREDLLEQALSYAEELEASKLKTSKKQSLENNRLLLELRQRDATIEGLEAEDVRKDKDLLKLKQVLVAYESKIGSIHHDQA